MPVAPVCLRAWSHGRGPLRGRPRRTRAAHARRRGPSREAAGDGHPRVRRQGPGRRARRCDRSRRAVEQAARLLLLRQQDRPLQRGRRAHRPRGPRRALPRRRRPLRAARAARPAPRDAQLGAGRHALGPAAGLGGPRARGQGHPARGGAPRLLARARPRDRRRADARGDRRPLRPRDARARAAGGRAHAADAPAGREDGHRDELPRPGVRPPAGGAARRAGRAPAGRSAIRPTRAPRGSPRPRG